MNWKLFSVIKDFLEWYRLFDFARKPNSPSIYRNLAVNLAHAGHLEVTKTKALLRSKVFSRNMEKITTQVLGLFASRKSVHHLPVYLWYEISSKSEIYYSPYWQQNKYWEYKQWIRKKIFPLLSNTQKSIMTSDIKQKISLYKLGAESWLSKKKLSKLTSIFGPKPGFMIEKKWTLIKAKAENRGHLVIRNILDFRKIPKGAASPNSTSDESDDGFEHSRHGTIDN